MAEAMAGLKSKPSPIGDLGSVLCVLAAIHILILITRKRALGESQHIRYHWTRGETK